MTSPSTEYALLDSGGLRRLERFGSVVVSRPAPSASYAPALPKRIWDAADLAYDAAGWRGAPPPGWRVAFGSAVLLPRTAPQGALGVFPEHARVCQRLDDVLSRAAPPPDGRRALNLFAHTGLLTLRLAALPGAGETVHVDASRAALNAARDNAAASGLADARIRWLADDALAFMAREIRRGRRYDVVAADPPAYGRDRKSGKEWRLERDLPALVECAAKLLSPGGVLCVSCHSEGWTGERLARAMRDGAPSVRELEAMDLSLRPEGEGMPLAAGFAAFGFL